MNRRILLTATAAVTALGVLGACDTTGGTGGTAGTGGTGGNAGAASSSSSSGATSSAAPGKKLSEVTIGFAQRQVDAPYYSAMVQRAKDIAQQKGFKLLVQNANSDPVTQINQVNTMVSQGADLIVVNAVSPQAEKAQLSEAAKNTPLMFIDTAIPDVGFTAVQSDNAAIGSDAGQLMAKRVGSGKTLKLAILNGGPTDAIVGPARQQGFLDGLKKGGVTVNVVASAPGEYSKDKAVPATENMLSAHSDIQAVLGLNDAMALGALDVLDRAGKKDVLVSGIDGQKEALAEIKKGGCTGQYVSTGLNSPKLATDKVMEIAEQVTTGQKQPSSYPATSFTTAVGIGCENVDKYYDSKSVF